MQRKFTFFNSLTENKDSHSRLFYPLIKTCISFGLVSVCVTFEVLLFLHKRSKKNYLKTLKKSFINAQPHGIYSYDDLAYIKRAIFPDGAVHFRSRDQIIKAVFVRQELQQASRTNPYFRPIALCYEKLMRQNKTTLLQSIHEIGSQLILEYYGEGFYRSSEKYIFLPTIKKTTLPLIAHEMTHAIDDHLETLRLPEETNFLFAWFSQKNRMYNARHTLYHHDLLTAFNEDLERAFFLIKYSTIITDGERDIANIIYLGMMDIKKNYPANRFPAEIKSTLVELATRSDVGSELTYKYMPQTSVWFFKYVAEPCEKSLGVTYG